MRTLLILLLSSCLLAACSSSKKKDGDAPFGVYRIDIQQGNVLTQEMVNQLRPGMNKRQIQFVMGTPLLSDLFHPNRWDYIYTLKPGRGEKVYKRVTLLFEGDKLVSIDGTMKPQQGDFTAAAPDETVVVVPNRKRPRRGIFGRLMDKFDIRLED